MPRPTARAAQQFSPPAAARETSPAVIEVGGAVVHVERSGADVQVTVSIGSESRLLRCAVASVMGWCADAALLLAASLEVGAGDEAELRTPMLVAHDRQCIAMKRRIRAGSSAISLLLTTSPDGSEAADSWSSGPAPVSAGNALVSALRDVAG